MPPIPDDLYTPVPVGDGVTVRLLPPDEWGRLSAAQGPLHGHPLPTDGAARILVAESAQDIIGYWVVSAMIHLDPLWIDAEHRTRPKLAMGLLGLLVTVLHLENIHFVYAVIADGDQPANGILAEKMGLSRLPGALYGGEIPEAIT